MKKISLLLLVCLWGTFNASLAETIQKPKFLFLAGSARKDSVNKKLARQAFEIAKKAGAEATFIDVKDYPMPIYDGDLEDAKGLPKKAMELKKIFTEHDGVFIASPEYNGSISPLLKNALDWVSRPSRNEKYPLAAFKNKIIALGSASPGSGGGRTGLIPLRMMFNNIDVLVIPEQINISKAYEKFDKHGLLTDEDDKSTLKEGIEKLIQVTSDLKKI